MSKYILDGTAEVLLQPVRLSIIKCLRAHPQGLFIDEIAKEVNISPRLVSHHIVTLEKRELVEASYNLILAKGSKRKIAVKVCTTTHKVDEVFMAIRESI